MVRLFRLLSLFWVMLPCHFAFAQPLPNGAWSAAGGSLTGGPGDYEWTAGEISWELDHGFSDFSRPQKNLDQRSETLLDASISSIAFVVRSTGNLGVEARVSRPAGSDVGCCYSSANALTVLRDTIRVKELSAEVIQTQVFGYSVDIDISGVVQLDGGSVSLAAAARTATPLGEQLSAADAWQYQDGGFFDTRPRSLTIATFQSVVLMSVVEPGENILSLELALGVAAVIPAGAGGFVEALFSNTLKVTNVVLFDEQGEIIHGVRLEGENGNEYPYNVPEPASGILILVATAAIAAWRQRR